MGRRGFAFLFLEPFLAVVAIKTEWETIASETKDVAGSVYTVVTARLSFTPGAWWRQGKTACEAPQPARRKERNDTRIINSHSASNRQRTQQIFSTLPLLCHNETTMGK